jgi:hypothetical protein
MPLQTVIERLPRFVRRPKSLPEFQITERDIEILKIIARLRFATSAQVIALILAMFPAADPPALAISLSCRLLEPTQGPGR